MTTNAPDVLYHLKQDDKTPTTYYIVRHTEGPYSNSEAIETVVFSLSEADLTSIIREFDAMHPSVKS